MLFHRNNSVLFKRQFEQLVVIVSSNSLANNVYRNIIFPLFLIKPKSMPHYNHIVHRVEVCNWYIVVIFVVPLDLEASVLSKTKLLRRCD